MLTDPADPTRLLIEPSDLDGELSDPGCGLSDLGSGHELVRRYGVPLKETVVWAREYLCRPHPDLGRKGPVCPYAQTSLDRGVFYLAVQPGTPDGDVVAEALDGYRDWFRALVTPPGTSPQYRTILVLFPDLPEAEAARTIDAAQRLLKPRYVGEGLMIGEFYPGPPPKAGLWNPDFLPLGSPVPMLVIRHMVATDFAFLREDREQLAAYLERFGDRPPAALRTEVEEAARLHGITVRTA
ncbi:DUF6875 domain-containing protein [Streptosporangium saharense]|uniref:DUF6875 domain-containing protein n=1 Tax=Streptosporangium saharense TaxID=1706840 RepID=UPI003696CABE